MDDIDAWVWWLIGAVGLGIPLVVTAMPEFGMLAVGAVAGAVTAGLGGGVVLQVVVFAVVSVALIAVVRPVATRHRSQRPQLATGIDALRANRPSSWRESTVRVAGSSSPERSGPRAPSTPDAPTK